MLTEEEKNAGLEGKIIPINIEEQMKSAYIDYSMSANETISCSYDGQSITIGFKSTFLVEILSNMDTPTVVVELADSTRAGVFKPVYDDKQTSATLMLLMPMMINA